MTRKEFKKAVAQAQTVYGWVNITDGDGAYMRLVKTDIKALINMYGDYEFQAVMRDDNDLYIN